MKSRLFIKISALIVASLVIILLSINAYPQKKEYTISVLPQKPPATMHKNWMPFINRLSEKTGLTFKLRLYDKMDSFEFDVMNGYPDFIFSTPTQTVLAKESQGYVPLVRSKHKVAGVIFVRGDSKIKSVKELENKDIVFTGSRNLCSILARDSLIRKLKIKFRVLYAGSTSNVYKTVLLGKAVAGATLDEDTGNEPGEVQKQIRNIFTSKKIAPHPISAHRRIPGKVREKVISAIMSMGKESASADLLKKVRLRDPVLANYYSDYEELESIDIKMLSNPANKFGK